MKEKEYFVITLHRPGNVDEEHTLKQLIEEIVVQAKGWPIIFPVHPRTAKNLQAIGMNAPNLHMIEPLGYLTFNFLVQHCKAVITDSGGITEETTVMDIPIGTNELIGTDPAAIGPFMEKIFSDAWKKGTIPDRWDGKAAERIIDIIIDLYP